MSTRRSSEQGPKRKGRPSRGRRAARGWPKFERTRPPGKLRHWFAAKGPVFRFVVILGGISVGFNTLFYVWLTKTMAFAVYLGVNAEVSAWLLRVLGHEVTATGVSLGSTRFSVQVQSGCDALQSSAFLIAAVLASPARVSLPARIPFMLLGTLFLLLLNVVRIVSLYYSGAYYPRMFDVLHIDLWQPVFILLPLLLWLIWARRARRHETETGDVPA